jgi:predicted nuclease with TOPRIM domain
MKQYNEMGAEIVKLEADLAEARAQIDKLDEAHQITQQGLWQDITELRASCASLRETKDTFFRNAEAWEAKYNEARAQIAAKDAELAELKGQWERLLEAYSAAKARSEH